MSEVREINDLNFESEVLASPVPFLLQFSATWCGPCKAMAPVLEDVARDRASQVRVGKIDIEESPNITIRFGVRGAPTLVMFREGMEIGRRLGAGGKREVIALMEAI